MSPYASASKMTAASALPKELPPAASKLQLSVLDTLVPDLPDQVLTYVLSNTDTTKTQLSSGS